MITAAQLAAVMPKADPGRWLAPLNQAASEYSIDKGERMPMFLAQVAAETGGLTVLEENLNYSAARLMAVWPNHFDSHNAQQYAGRPDVLADFIYANRNGNGGEQSGDGWLFHGRGGAMLTFRNNYVAAGKSLGLDDLATYPEQVATDATIAMRTAAWFFAQINGNALADAGDFEGLTKAWNGALGEAAGLSRRVAYWQTAQSVLV